MNKKLQVFVSSTYIDLIEERQAAVEAILDAGHIPAGMELFKAGKSQMQTIHKWIDDSDVYMLILGGRYGSIEEESGLSYTELEYRYALSKNMPVFAIVLENSYLMEKANSSNKIEYIERENIDKYNVFKEMVKSLIVKYIANINQISSVIHSQMNDIINTPENKLIGWIRYNTFVSDDKINLLINVLQNKQFIIPIHEASKNETGIMPQYKIYSALDIFYFIYHFLCIGLSKLAYKKRFNNYIYTNICPYYLSFGIVKKSITRKYIITPKGTLLYKEIELSKIIDKSICEELFKIHTHINQKELLYINKHLKIDKPLKYY